MGIDSYTNIPHGRGSIISGGEMSPSTHRPRLKGAISSVLTAISDAGIFENAWCSFDLKCGLDCLSLRHLHLASPYQPSPSLHTENVYTPTSGKQTHPAACQPGKEKNPFSLHRALRVHSAPAFCHMCA